MNTGDIPLNSKDGQRLGFVSPERAKEMIESGEAVREYVTSEASGIYALYLTK